MTRRDNILVCLFFAALLAGIVLYRSQTNEPPAYREAVLSNDAYDPRPMQEAMAPAALRAHIDTILARGSRFLGQSGFYAVADDIRRTYREAGLEIYELGNDTVVPRTICREILSADGAPLPNVEIYPLMPNQLQPMVTPDEGLTGELVLMTDEVYRTRPRFDDCIALVDSRPDRVPKALGLRWVNYARLGAKALIVSRPDGLDAVEWHRVAEPDGAMVADVPVNYVRLAASVGIFKHVGERVTLKVRTEYAVTPNRTIVGVLRAARPAPEAILLTAPYDACSVLPDRAPGVIQAIPIAVQQGLLNGLRKYRGSLERDVIFVNTGAHVMAHEGINNIIALLDRSRAAAESDDPVQNVVGPNPRRTPIEERAQLNDSAIRRIEALLACFDDAAFLVSPEVTGKRLAGLDDETAELLLEQVRYVLNTIVFRLSGDAQRARITFEKSDARDLDGPLFRTYLACRRAADEAVAAAGLQLPSLASSKKEFLERKDVRRRCVERLRELETHHQRRREVLEQSLALVDVFSPYSKLIVVNTTLLPAYGDRGQRESLTACSSGWGKVAAVDVMNNLLSTARGRLGLDDGVTLPGRKATGITRSDTYVPVADHFWSFLGYPAFTLMNADRMDAKWRYASPADLPFMRDMESIRHSAAVCGESILLMAHGNGVFPESATALWRKRDFGGQVLVANVGPTAVPNYPLKHALICPPSPAATTQWSAVGFYSLQIIAADVYGRFARPNTLTDFLGWASYWSTRGYSPLAVGYDERGLIYCIKDEGPDGQRLYKSVGLSGTGEAAFDDVTIVTFRAAPVTLLDLTNPQTMKDFTGVELVSADGLTSFKKECSIAAPGMVTKFVEPDARFFVKFLAGTPENELAKETRSFMLGSDPSFEPDASRDIDGPGFLACDTPIIHRVPFEVANSMISVNGDRIALQNRYHMTDETTRRYFTKSEKLHAESLDPAQPFHDAESKARDAVAYSMLTHPVLRGQISEAVAGILWYLGLLVPFVFFFEKLVFGFSDIRKQLGAQAGIFLTVFLLLNLLHPAFQMVRTSLMILLGFVILLISSGITLLFAGKFRENLEQLNARRGKVVGAEVDTAGIVASAFVLGLNNMRRRKVRTGLTCATLVLITVVMICFTSIASNEINASSAIGKAPYQGILYKDERYKPLTGLDVVRARYGDRFQLAERRMLLGARAGSNPELEAIYERGDVLRRVAFDSLLQFSACEPLRTHVRFLTRSGWFSKSQENATDTLCPVLIPDTMAETLGLFPANVDQGEVYISIKGRRFRVHGIFEADSVNALRDLDGRDLLPFDLAAMERAPGSKGYPLAEDDAPRIDASRLVITPNRALGIEVRDANDIRIRDPRLVSVAIQMPALPYKEARTLIEAHLEQTGRAAFYGLDGVAFLGERGRRRSFVGLIDLLIPLIVAALTVVNTMKGSVYERRDEIFVYNAVGIAPKYIFFMFFTEAFVYAVMGSVLGYLISQGIGRVLTELDMTGGMNMTFTSINTIYASLAVAASVFASTWFPARSAMTIAAPAEDAGWRLPEPDGDDLSFDLPFTFNYRDRIAILAFFERYLADHGEGGAGRFYAGALHVGVRDEPDPLADGALVPQITAAIWLKPFDLAVSQRMALAVLTDEETGEFKARITLTRLSGTRESWLRLNKGFVAIVRRHLLHWRAVSPEDRSEMFDEARSLLERFRSQALTTDR